MTTILIVDDYIVTQRVLSTQLRKQGFDILIAGGGAEALGVIEESAVDLMIVDIAMPDMDGITLLRKIRAKEQFMNLPIIMLTASGQDSDRILAEASGASAFLTKPSSSTELGETIRRCLDVV